MTRAESKRSSLPFHNKHELSLQSTLADMVKPPQIIVSLPPASAFEDILLSS